MERSARRLVLVAALALGACAPPPACSSAPLRQDEVLELVWHVALAEDGEPPTIEWVPGEPCKGLRDPAILVGAPPNLTCAAGTYAAGRVRLVIPHRSPALDRPFGPFSSSAIVHELVHAHLERALGDPDSDHLRRDVWAVVPPLNAMLVADGL